MVESNSSFKSRLHAAIECLVGSGTMASSSTTPQRINERLASAGHVAEIRTAHVNRAALYQVNQLLTQSHNASTWPKLHLWLKRAADTFATAVAPHAACSPGRSHCCHIPLKITEAKATEIGKAIGLAPADHASFQQNRLVEFESCPFLYDDACSIYKDRPIVCRTHFNMDADDHLCQIVPGASVPVPYMDNRTLLFRSHFMGEASPRIADMRSRLPKALANSSLLHDV